MFEYAIAYYGAFGECAQDGSPYVYVGIQSEEEAEISLQRIRGIDMVGDACIFFYRKDRHPEAFTMAFVEAHRKGEWC